MGQGLVHTGHDGVNAGVRIEIAVEHRTEPAQLRIAELVMRRIVEGDEVHAVVHPVIPGTDGGALGPVFLALRGDLRPVEEGRELDDVPFARHGRDRLVVPTAEKHRNGVEGRDLVGEEVIPGTLLIFGFGHRHAGGFHGLHVLVFGGHPAEIPKVPVKDVVGGLHLGGNGRHHEIATVAAVS